jgi:hypothetical protein
MILKAFGLLFLSAVACIGQSAIEPDIADVFWRFDDGRLAPLERQSTGTTHGKVGFGSMKITAQLPGGRSPVRFHAGVPLEFIVRSPMATTTDPATIYSLWILDAKKDKRELMMMTSSGSRSMRPQKQDSP